MLTAEPKVSVTKTKKSACICFILFSHVIDLLECLFNKKFQKSISINFQPNVNNMINVYNTSTKL